MYDLVNGKIIYKPAKKNRFNVCITGNYGTGKSTLINCLTGRTIQNSSLFFDIGFIQTIYGPNNGMARVSWQDYSRTEMVIPFELLRKLKNDPQYAQDIQGIKYITLTDEIKDPRFCYREEYFGRWDDIYDASNDLDAIVVVLFAPRFGSIAESEYIETHYAGRGLRNVFFVINGRNLLRDEDKEYFSELSKRLLGPVFTDASGYFDEALYNQRVFPVDAYTSQCARTGVPREERRGVKFVKTPIAPEEDAHTGVPDFERALYRFLGLEK